MTKEQIERIMYHRARYDRLKSQVIMWAQGISSHNRMDDTCVPDGSCCRRAHFLGLPKPDPWPLIDRVRWVRWLLRAFKDPEVDRVLLPAEIAREMDFYRQEAWNSRPWDYWDEEEEKRRLWEQKREHDRLYKPQHQNIPEIGFFNPVQSLPDHWCEATHSTSSGTVMAQIKGEPELSTATAGVVGHLNYSAAWEKWNHAENRARRGLWREQNGLADLHMVRPSGSAAAGEDREPDPA